MALLAGACQRSQFATTTRQTRNGKVTYVNHHPIEKRDYSKVKTPENTLFASASNEPVILADNKNQFTIVPSDTSIKAVPQKPKIIEVTKVDTVIMENIKIRNEEPARIKVISRSGDTLKYESVAEKGVIRSILKNQIDSVYKIDTIFTKSTYKNKVKPAPPEDHYTGAKKKEPLGIAAFVLSIVGLVPLFGLPFAILGLILGIVSLNKINRHPKRFYNTKWMGTAAIVLGIVGMVITIGYIITVVSIAVHSMYVILSSW